MHLHRKLYFERDISRLIIALMLCELGARFWACCSLKQRNHWVEKARWTSRLTTQIKAGFEGVSGIDRVIPSQVQEKPTIKKRRSGVKRWKLHPFTIARQREEIVSLWSECRRAMGILRQLLIYVQDDELFPAVCGLGAFANRWVFPPLHQTVFWGSDSYMARDALIYVISTEYRSFQITNIS